MSEYPADRPAPVGDRAAPVPRVVSPATPLGGGASAAPLAPPPARHADGRTSGERSNARIGMILFAVYVVLYVGFIYLSAFQRQTMQGPSLGGVNLGTVFGLGLIVAAFLLALVYMVLAKRSHD